MRMRYLMNAGSRLFKLVLCLAVFEAVAAAGTILGSFVSFGNTTGFSVPNSGSTSASQFDEAATNASIQAACPAGYTCSPLTLYEIDFTLTANTSGTVTVNNANAGTAYIQPITGLGGTFGNPTSGTALQQITTIDLKDPLANVVDEVIPTASIATDVEGKKTVTPCTGSATSLNFLNCLSVSTGTHAFTGSGSDTQSGSYLSGDLTPAVLAAYVGSGTVNFTLTSSGGENNGTLPINVTIQGNSATVQSLTDALQVSYLYSYEETLGPEPATFLMLGSALIGIAWMLKRRQHKT